MAASTMPSDKMMIKNDIQQNDAQLNDIQQNYNKQNDT